MLHIFERLAWNTTSGKASLSCFNEIIGDLIPLNVFCNIQIQHFVKEVIDCSSGDRSYFDTNLAFGLILENITELFVLMRSSSYLIRYEYLTLLDLLVCVENGSVSTSFKGMLFESCQKELLLRPPIQDTALFYPLYLQKMTKISVFLQPNVEHMIDLLTHPMEEVRMEVLQHFSVDACAQKMLAHELVAFIENDTGYSTESRSVALSLLTRSSCLYQHTWGRQFSRPENPSENDRNGQVLWALGLYQTAINDNFRCAALVAIGQIIHHGIADGSIDTRHLLEWSSCLLNECDSRAIMRLAVVETLETCVEMLDGEYKRLRRSSETSENEQWAVLLSTLWTCLFRCLSDDEESVRTKASDVVKTLTEDQRTFHPTIALEKALEHYTDTIGHVYPEQVLLALSNLALNAEEEEEKENPAFEKGDSDAFRDPLFHSILYTTFIRRLAVQNHASLSGLGIGESLRSKWHCLSNFDASTCQDIIHRRRSINNFIVDCLKLFFLTKSLETVDESIAALHRQIRDHFSTMPKYCIGYLTSLHIFDDKQ